MDEQQVAPHGFETRLQSVLQALILALLIGFGVAVVDLVKSVARLDVKSEQGAKDFSELKAEMASLRTQTTNAAIAAANAATATAQAATAASQALQQTNTPKR